MVYFAYNKSTHTVMHELSQDSQTAQLRLSPTARSNINFLIETVCNAQIFERNTNAHAYKC